MAATDVDMGLERQLPRRFRPKRVVLRQSLSDLRPWNGTEEDAVTAVQNGTSAGNRISCHDSAYLTGGTDVAWDAPGEYEIMRIFVNRSR